jgi:hypothetical protein
VTKAKMLAVAALEFLLGALISGTEPFRLHSENPDEEPQP